MSNSFVTPWTVAHQVLLSIGFPRQEYWSGLPFPSPGDLPDPEIEFRSFVAEFFTTELPGKPPKDVIYSIKNAVNNIVITLYGDR